MTRFALRTLPFALLLLSASPARSDDVPNNTVRIGEYWVWYHTTASDLAGPYVPAGVNFTVGNVTTPYVAYLRRLSTHFTTELAFGVPPLTKTYLAGPPALGALNGQEISTARWVAPTALLEYVFLDDSYPVRPYIGAGVNYTAFVDRDSTAIGNEASGGPTRISLTHSLGAAGTAGVNWQLARHWSVMASYSMTRVATHLTADTEGFYRTSIISFAPSALVIAAGFSF